MKVRLLPVKNKFYKQKEFWQAGFIHPYLRIPGLILLIFLISGTANRVDSHDLKIVREDIQLSEALTKLSQKYEVFFSYDEKMVEGVEVSYEPEHYRDIEHALNELLAETSLRYKIFDNRYIILYEESQEAITSLKGMVRHLESVIDSQEEISNARKKEKSVPFLSRTIQSQIKPIAFTVSGTVTDQSGETLIGVNIQVKGTNKGTATDFEGNFTLKDIDENAILIISYVGYETQEVLVAGKSNVSITLLSDSELLDEVVVVGYGTQKRVNVIGSISAISGDELTASPVGRIGNALTGRLPGATVMETSGKPGTVPTIRIRGNSTLGNNSPLLIIDGVPGDINTLLSEDIESISVLKDASAAIYGARAANGVILVTTKQGGFDQAPKLRYSVYQGTLSPTKLPKMADAATYATMRRENELYNGVTENNLQYSEDDIAKFASGEYPWTHPNTDWFKEGLRNNSSTTHHSLSVNGGSEKINYYASFGSQGDDGIYENNATSYKRYNLRANINVKINEFLKIGLNLSGVQEDRMDPTRSAGTIYTYLIRGYPTAPALFPNGFIGPGIADGNNPLAASSDVTGFDDDKDYKSNNLLSAELKIPGIDGLKLSGYFAYNFSQGHRKLFEKPWTLYSFNKDAYLDAGNTGKEDGSAFLIPSLNGYSEPRLNNYSSRGTSKTTNLKLDYTRTFLDDHDVSAFISYENDQSDSQNFNAYRRFFLTDKLPYLFAGGDNAKDNNESVSIGARVNYFGRISYNYKGTYLFQFSLRRDGSLRFSKESGRWGNFPSLLFGWRPSNYEWWKNNVEFVDYFKLKASWGKMGNDAVAPFQYLSSYKFSRWGYLLGNNKDYKSGLEQANVPNPDITWEVSNMYNIGWETLLFGNLINFDTDFFFERRNDILVTKNASIPEFTGLTLPDENFGIVESRGIELVLGYGKPSGNFTYRINGSFSFARNKVIEFDEPERSVPWQRLTGTPQGALLLYKSVGIFKDEAHVESMPHVTGARPGDIIFEDFDGDGKITNDDRQLIPLTNTPEITYGLTLDIAYKGFELRGLLHGADRGIRRAFYHIQGSGGNYFQWSAEDRWTPENTIASKPRAFERQQEYWRSDDYISDFDYMPISFLRVKNLQLKYNFSAKLLENIDVIDGLSVYVSTQNPWILYSGNEITDPESSGVASYPIMKVFSLGAQITLK